MSDASNSGLGATIFQVQPDGTRRLVASKSHSLTDTESRWSVIEKEALGIAWPLEKFDMYILGHPDVTVETDHKPLVPIFNSKAVNDLTIRIQRQRLRAMKYAFNNVHVPSKLNCIADLLSRQPLNKPNAYDAKVSDEFEVCAVTDLSRLPASENRLLDLKRQQSADTTCRQIIYSLQHGWPAYLSGVDTDIKPYWEVQSDLTLVNGLLLKGSRIVMPIQERADILKRIHCGHQGIQKCRERSRQSVWWPGISLDIAAMVKNSKIYQIHKAEQHEALKPSEFPDRPWQRVATDLFNWQSHNYILVIDYYSRYIEIAKLNALDSATTITVLK